MLGSRIDDNFLIGSTLYSSREILLLDFFKDELGIITFTLRKKNCMSWLYSYQAYLYIKNTKTKYVLVFSIELILSKNSEKPLINRTTCSVSGNVWILLWQSIFHHLFIHFSVLHNSTLEQSLLCLEVSNTNCKNAAPSSALVNSSSARSSFIHSTWENKAD